MTQSSPNRKKVLVIIPDRLTKATGGMGENSAPVFQQLSDTFDFYVAGFPLMGETVPEYITEYREVFNPFTQVNSGAVSVLNGQIKYFAAAISFPKPDIVYAYDWSIYLSAVETANYFKVPLVTRMCLSAIELGREGFAFGLNLNEQTGRAVHNSLCEMEIRGMQKADVILQISKGYAKRWEKIPKFLEKTVIVPNGIDVKKWLVDSQNEYQYQLPGENKLKVVYLGRITKLKGVLELCSAIIPDDIDLVFIGSLENAEPMCREMIEKKILECKNVFSIGALYGNDKVRALRSAQGIIVPSLHEPFGTVGLEGLASKCIVLSSRVDGLGDYLTNENSIYCGTKSETISIALNMLRNLSTESIEKMHGAGIETCQQYSLESTVRQLKAVFGSL